MTDPAPVPSSVPPAEPKAGEFYRTIRVSPDLAFDICIGAEADDPISQFFARGIYPTSHLLDLILGLTRRGDRVLDLGAHIGALSLAAAASGREVVAVEASPRNAALVQASAARNGFQHLRVIHAAVASRPGTLHFCPRGPFGHVAVPGMNAIAVRALAVDELLTSLGWDRVALIKMDVEGSEPAAIQGMTRLLRRADAPPILYESNGHTLHLFQKTPTQLKSALEQCGYRNYQLAEHGSLLPVAAEDLQPECCVDYLAVKGTLPNLAGWRLAPPLSHADQLAKVLALCGQGEAPHRAHLARVLETAPGWLLATPAVEEALAVLRADPSQEVRAAVAWSDKRRGRNRWGQRLLAWWRKSA